MKYYGAYGSNLNKKQMKNRCPLSEPITRFCLLDWRLVFKGVADIERKKGSRVYLGLYSITSYCENALDYYEDFPELYKKKYMSQVIQGKKIEFMLYTMNKAFNYSAPTRKYFKAIKEGYGNWKLDKNILFKSGLHSIENNTGNGYKSKNWKDKELINISCLNDSK